MSDQDNTGEACMHACTWGCGRKYDIVVTQVIDASTLFLCIPCFMSFAHNVMQAMVDADSADVKDVTASADLTGVMLVTESESATPVRGFSDPEPADDEFAFDGM